MRKRNAPPIVARIPKGFDQYVHWTKDSLSFGTADDIEYWTRWYGSFAKLQEVLFTFVRVVDAKRRVTLYVEPGSGGLEIADEATSAEARAVLQRHAERERGGPEAKNLTCELRNLLPAATDSNLPEAELERWVGLLATDVGGSFDCDFHVVVGLDEDGLAALVDHASPPIPPHILALSRMRGFLVRPRGVDPDVLTRERLVHLRGAASEGARPGWLEEASDAALEALLQPSNAAEQAAWCKESGVCSKQLLRAITVATR